MGDFNWDSDDDDNDGSDDSSAKQAPKGLRAHAKRLEAENAEFRKRLDEFEAANRKAAVEKAVTSKGYNPKVAGLIPKDVAADAVEKWLEDYGEIFGPAKTQEQQDSASEEDEFEFGQVSRINAAAGRGETPSKQADMYAELTDKNLTPERLMAMIEAAGGGYGA